MELHGVYEVEESVDETTAEDNRGTTLQLSCTPESFLSLKVARAFSFWLIRLFAMHWLHTCQGELLMIGFEKFQGMDRVLCTNVVDSF